MDKTQFLTTSKGIDVYGISKFWLFGINIATKVYRMGRITYDKKEKEYVFNIRRHPFFELENIDEEGISKIHNKIKHLKQKHGLR